MVRWSWSAGVVQAGRSKVEKKGLAVVLRTWLASVLAPSMTALTFLNICSCDYVVTSCFSFGIKVHPEEPRCSQLGPRFHPR
jgi:hypothetical protein